MTANPSTPKRVSLSLLTLLALSAITPAAFAEGNVEIGDSRETVTNVLGEPMGKIKAGQDEIFQFKRGIVTIRDNKVLSSTIASTQEIKERKAQRVATQARGLEQQKERKQAHLEKGEAEKDAKLESESFQNKSAREKVAYWKKFAKTYPEIDVSSQIAGNLAEAEAQLKAELPEITADVDAKIVVAEKERDDALAASQKRYNRSQRRKRASYKTRAAEASTKIETLQAERAELIKKHSQF